MPTYSQAASKSWICSVLMINFGVRNGVTRIMMIMAMSCFTEQMAAITIRVTAERNAGRLNVFSVVRETCQ